MGTKVRINKALLSFAHVHEPKMMPDGQNEKYSASLIIDHNDAKSTVTIEGETYPVKEGLELAIKKELIGKFGEKAVKGLGKSYHNPLRDGDDKASEAYGADYEGKLFVNASSNNAPGLLGIDKERIAPGDESDESGIYSGCIVAATVSFFPFEVTAKKGVGCGLNNLAVRKYGPRLDGRTSAEDDFDDLDDDDLD